MVAIRVRVAAILVAGKLFGGEIWRGFAKRGIFPADVRIKLISRSSVEVITDRSVITANIIIIITTSSTNTATGGTITVADFFLVMQELALDRCC